MKSTSLNRKLLVLVVTALLLGTLAVVFPLQSEPTSGNTQMNESYEKIASKADPEDDDGVEGEWIRM